MSARSAKGARLSAIGAGRSKIWVTCRAMARPSAWSSSSDSSSDRCRAPGDSETRQTVPRGRTSSGSRRSSSRTKSRPSTPPAPLVMNRARLRGRVVGHGQHREARRHRADQRGGRRVGGDGGPSGDDPLTAGGPVGQVAGDHQHVAGGAVAHHRRRRADRRHRRGAVHQPHGQHGGAGGPGLLLEFGDAPLGAAVPGQRVGDHQHGVHLGARDTGTGQGALGRRAHQLHDVGLGPPVGLESGLRVGERVGQVRRREQFRQLGHLVRELPQLVGGGADARDHPWARP